MKIILIITANKKLIKNIPSLELKSHNPVVLKNTSFIKHYIEEYIPEYIILSSEFKDYKEIADYIRTCTSAKLLIIDSEDGNNNFSGDIYLSGIKDSGDLERVLSIIDNLDSGTDIKMKNNLKLMAQKVISFYSIQGGVGKTSIVFNFAWHIRKVIEGKILIIDLNFCEGPSDLTINLNLDFLPNLSVFIEEITGGKNCFNSSVINLKNDDRIDILQPPLSIYQSDRFNIDMLDSIVYSARNKYDVIVADIPFRYDNISLEMLNLSTTSILVLSTDINLIPRISNFKKFLPEEQKKGIIFNKVTGLNKPYIDECKNILGIPVFDRIPFVPEECRELIGSRDSFNILNLQSEMSDLTNCIF